MNKLFFYACSALLASGAALTAVSCADDDLDNGGTNGKDAVVHFSVNDVQEGAISRGVMTRGAITPGLGSSDLAGGKLTAHSNRNIDVCLIETTVEGVNPVKSDAHTRANIIKTSTLGDFSASGIRGTSASTLITTPEWFHAKKTKSNGELYSPIYWAFSQPSARFFAVSPNVESYSKMTINNTDATGRPSVEFEVDPDVTKEVDLMTACTGDVEYTTQGVQPTTKLDFRHALTGIRFAVGQNLSWNKTIDKVELRNVLLKSKYVLSKQLDGTGAAWDHTGYSMRGTAALSGVSVSTNHNPNITIMGNTGDNFTFYMIPQVLTGNNVKVNVHCTDGTVIDVVLKGEWKAGTTRTYKLSQTNSTWHYVLTPTNPSRAAEYEETTSQPYSIMSYREDPVTHTKQAVAWKVIGYSVDNGTTWTTTKPAWLTALSAESGDGGTAADQGTATLRKDITDRLAMYNKVLHDAAQKGSSSNPYDLSKHDFKGNDTQRNTANCYLISAPGYYKIPLVYGNAVKGGADNPSSYKTSNTGTYILKNFKDHAGVDIASPYINVQNSGNPATQASIVWTDQSGIVDGLSVTNAGANSYVNFHVPQDKIKNGNAVIAVKNASGTVMWSWHLWFDHSDVLNTIACTNYQGQVYNFTKQTLGFAYRKWEASTYDKPRVVRVKVEQTIANGGTKQFAYIDITQNPGSVKEISSTLYQFGRKDAMPVVQTVSDGSFTANGGDQMSVTNGIQHPETFYTYGSTWDNGYNQYNLWSMNNTTTGYNDNSVVKTIYDPCPAGFHMPASNAFTGFTTTGQTASTQSQFNVSGAWDWGWNFNNKITSPDAAVYFPALGFRYRDGSLYNVGGYGYYWSAVPYGTSVGCYLYFFSGLVGAQSNNNRSNGCSVRPVSE